MTPRSLAAVLLKCMGLFLLISALRHFEILVQFIGENPGPSSGGLDPRTVFLEQAAFGLVLIAIGIVLLVNTDVVLKLFFRNLGDAAETPDTPATPFAYHAMALSIVGAWVLATAIPDLVSRAAIVLSLSRARFGTGFDDWWARAWITALHEVVAAAVGLALFLASRRIAAYWFARQAPESAKSARDGPSE